MKCEKCNAELQPHWNFCTNCGKQVYKDVVSYEPDYDPNDYPEGFDPVVWGLEG
ncbi:MAG: zinc ribbon domain-containing protein [Ignavibacteria bacterium]|nr:zinc ribbon domain-containing protein [Ignavibacteria bacterium]